jgi:hypothetical protein
MSRRSNIAPTDARTKDVGLGLYIGPWQEFKLAKFREQALKQFREEWQRRLSERLDDVDAANLNDALGPLLAGLPMNEVVTLRDLKTSSRPKNPGREGSGGSTISAPAATGGPRPAHREDPNAALSDAGDIRAFSSGLATSKIQDGAAQAKQREMRRGIVARKQPSVSGRSVKSNSSSVSSSRTGVYSSGSSQQSSKASSSDAPKKVQSSIKWSSKKKKTPVAKSSVHNGTDRKKAAMVMKMVRRKDANQSRKPPRPKVQRTAKERNVSHINKMRKMYAKGIHEAAGGEEVEVAVDAEVGGEDTDHTTDAPQPQTKPQDTPLDVSVAFPTDDDDLESVLSDDLDGAVDDLINWTDGLDIDAMDDEFNFAF